MSDLKPNGENLNVNGVDRNILFTLNAIDEIQEEFKAPIDDVMKQLTDEQTLTDTLRILLVILLNDEAERKKFENNGVDVYQEVTSKEMGWFLNINNLWETTFVLLKAYGISIPEMDENEYETPNVTSEQQKN